MNGADTSGPLIYFFGGGQAEGGGDLKHLVGGKGASLADMTKAGLNVPPGFTISAACCDLYFKSGRAWPLGLDEAVRAALVRLEQLAGQPFGRGNNPLLVAVRSGAAQSMPGMMDTVLNVGSGPGDPWQQLRRAINAVFDSWHSERAVAYRRHHQIDGLLGTAVTVQMMCPSEVSGVLFTADPVSGARERLVVESARGLGEAVVQGKVTPDRFVLDRDSLRVVLRAIASSEGPTLRDQQLAELGRLGLRVEAHFGAPCDVEWGLVGGQFYWLQSRPIKGLDRAVGWVKSARPTTVPVGLADSTHPTADLEQVRQEEIAALRQRAEPGGTVWARFNLSEVLPEPTPMTWAVVRRLMAGRGGYGLMYRDLGFDPDPSLDEDGAFDLVCGRPYCNLSREARLHFRKLPFEHNFARLKESPHRAFYPQPTINPGRAGWRFWLAAPVLLPRVFLQMIRADRIQHELAQSLPAMLRGELFPRFAAETAEAAAADWSQVEEQTLLERLEHWVQRTLIDFARDALKPTALAGLALAKVERMLLPTLGPERTRASVGELTMGVRPDPEADLPSALQELTSGRLDRETFLRRFGHRASQEMELAQPRWTEQPPAEAHSSGGVNQPLLPDQQGLDERLISLAEEAKLPGDKRAALASAAQELHTHLALRETAKHYLLMGYALIRRALVELDRRHGLGNGIFFLTPDELPRLVRGDDLSVLIAERRRHRELALSLEVPSVLFSDDLERIGKPSVAAPAELFRGVGLSAGVAEGPALVLHEPTGAAPTGVGYILVCPSTDPAWVPLFVRAKGLVMETGGVLSHGAILAREFGLPAVAGLPDVHRRLRTGQRLSIDGAAGTVSLLPGP